MWKYSRTPLAQEATQDADEPMQAPDDISKLAERVAEMRASLDALRPAFEYSTSRVVGGVPSASSYTIFVPFLSPCEVSVVSTVFTDTATGTTISLSNDPNLDISASNSAAFTTTLDGNQGFLYLATGFSATAPGSPVWFPIPPDGVLTCRVYGSGSKAAYLVLQFRRRINP